jgi:hypothetical protein
MFSIIRDSGEARVVSRIRLNVKFRLVHNGQLKVMVRYSLEEKIEICEIYHRTCSIIFTQREFRQKFGKKPPSKRMILYQQTKFRETGSVKRRQYERARPVLTETKMDEILEFFLINPKTSLFRAAQQLRISETSLRRAVRKELKFCSYKIQILEAKQPGDKEKRLEFALETLALIHLDENVLSNLWISDEAYFCLSGTVNKQNMRFWGLENPNVVHEQPLHDAKLLVWCAMSEHGIIGPYFFEGTVNSERYREMLNTFFFPELRALRIPLATAWFQQDGATAHCSNQNLELLEFKFGERLISRRTQRPWPPRSPDLSSCDFFLWGYLKSKVYANGLNSLQDLRRNIEQEIREISHEKRQKVMRNFVWRLQECVRMQGGHLEHIL